MKKMLFAFSCSLGLSLSAFASTAPVGTYQCYNNDSDFYDPMTIQVVNTSQGQTLIERSQEGTRTLTSSKLLLSNDGKAYLLTAASTPDSEQPKTFYAIECETTPLRR